MCGIAGIIDFAGNNVREDLLDSMGNSMAHRGPDGSGLFAKENIGLVHRRLSIIDIDGGAQPMSNENGDIQLVFNGEIYNFREIRRELQDKGHIFKTRSDTESLVHLYEEYGSACVSKLNGFFAFAIADTKRKKILLARDRFGKKPLAYFSHQNVFAFASEIQALKKIPEFPQEINTQALHDYFSLQYIPAPATAYKNVFKLPPSHILELDTQNGNFSIEKYWNLDFNEKKVISEADAKRELYELLLDAVKMRLVADVPIGVFLSGGLDSSIITALMAELGVSPLRTFTVGFTEKLYDERYSARKVSAKFATCHFEKMGNPNDFNLLKRLIEKIGEPYADSSILPTAIISAFAAEEVKVVLVGDGADELFCGYHRYLLMKYASFSDILPDLPRKMLFSAAAGGLGHRGSGERTLAGKLRRILKAFAENPNQRYYNIIVRFDEEMKKNIYGERMRNCEFRNTCDYLKGIIDQTRTRDKVEKLQSLDIDSYLPGDILVKVDTASMANSLEARSPFLDYRVANFATSLPRKFKQRGFQRKFILKNTFGNLLPPEILRKEKKGFGVPIADWFRNGWKKYAEEYILDGKAVTDSYIRRDVSEKLLREHNTAQKDHSYAILALLSFAIWLET